MKRSLIFHLFSSFLMLMGLISMSIFIGIVFKLDTFSSFPFEKRLVLVPITTGFVAMSLFMDKISRDEHSPLLALVIVLSVIGLFITAGI